MAFVERSPSPVRFRMSQPCQECADAIQSLIPIQYAAGSLTDCHRTFGGDARRPAMTILLLLANALLLGFKHGIDWDHIAAIMDITGSATSSVSAQSFAVLQRRAVTLSSMYALGHAMVVAALGIAALCFATILPKWTDPLMERIVGFTLVVLGFWVFYSLWRYLNGKGDFQLQSRWMLTFAIFERAFNWLRARFFGRANSDEVRVRNYGKRTAFGVGMIHGIGAETGSQVLLIAAIGGSTSHGIGIAILAAFLVGLLLSNTVIAILGATGFITSARLRPAYIMVGALAGAFSLVVGAFFIGGIGDALPDLQRMLGA